MPCVADDYDDDSALSDATTRDASDGCGGGWRADRLHVLELQTCSQTVIPFQTWREQPTPDEHKDMEALLALVQERFSFDLRPAPPPLTPETVAARAACGPRWVWSGAGAHAPREWATASELRAAARELPGGTSAAVPLLANDPVPPIARIGPDAHLAARAGGTIDVAAWAQEYIAQAASAGVALSVDEWRAAAERLAAPPELCQPRLQGRRCC